jgi:hypothetical protein
VPKSIITAMLAIQFTLPFTKFHPSSEPSECLMHLLMRTHQFDCIPFRDGTAIHMTFAHDGGVWIGVVGPSFHRFCIRWSDPSRCDAWCVSK